MRETRHQNTDTEPPMRETSTCGREPDVGNTEARSPDVANPTCQPRTSTSKHRGKEPDVTNPDVPAANLDLGNTRQGARRDEPRRAGREPDVPAANPTCRPRTPTCHGENRRKEYRRGERRRQEPRPQAANIDVGISTPKRSMRRPDLAKANPTWRHRRGEHRRGARAVIVIDLDWLPHLRLRRRRGLPTPILCQSPISMERGVGPK